jgi:hypothetical protein
MDPGRNSCTDVVGDAGQAAAGSLKWCATPARRRKCWISNPQP